MCKNARVHWDDLRTVLAIHRAGTHSGAGALLGGSHTTVSRRLRACERHIDPRETR